jgi:hypothetical protein
VRIRFTDFCSKLARHLSGRFTRRVSGGEFSVKVGSVKRNAHQSLTLTKSETFHFAFPETLARLSFGGLARLRRGLLI